MRRRLAVPPWHAELMRRGRWTSKQNNLIVRHILVVASRVCYMEATPSSINLTLAGMSSCWIGSPIWEGRLGDPSVGPSYGRRDGPGSAAAPVTSFPV